MTTAMTWTLARQLPTLSSSLMFLSLYRNEFVGTAR